MTTSANEFLHSILRSILLSNDLYGADNIDTSYPAQGFGRAPADTADARTRYLEFFLDHSGRFHNTWSVLVDEQSKSLFVALILFRILGYRRIRLPIARDAYDAARVQSKSLPGAVSRFAEAAGAALRHYEFTVDSASRLLDCLNANLFFSFFLKQYYFDRSGVKIQPSPGDVVVDAGACFGDTAIAFSLSAGETGHVYAFEVVSSHLEIIAHNLSQNPGIRNITVCPFALGEHEQEGTVASRAPDPGYSLRNRLDTVPVRSLDSLVADGSIHRVDFLKMDIEGYELAALRGAAKSIRRFRPKLAISIYHNWEDYFAIPEFIQSLDLGYRLYLDNYTLSDGETILYGVCEDRAG